jgi:THO complex subunit 2
MLGNLFDRINDTLIQFIQFLRYHTNESYQLYSQLLPKDALSKLTLKYKIAPEVAFYIVRQSIKPIYAMTDEERTDLVEMFKRNYDEYVPEKCLKINEDAENLTPDHVTKSVRTQIWKNITPEFYTVFWTLNLDNIYVPVDRYDDEIKRLQEELQQLEGKSANESGRQAKSKKEKNIERLKGARENFEQEKKKLIENRDKVDAFLNQRKEFLFLATAPGPGVTTQKSINNYAIQTCFFLRCMFSPADAMFCAKFVEKLHKLKKASFTNDLLHSIYNIVNRIIPCIQCSTEREVYNMGQFFSELFSLVSMWNDETKLKQEAKKYQDNVDISYTQYVVLAIFLKVRIIILNFLSSKEFMQVRNSLVFLNCISNVFPPIEEDAKILMPAIDQLQNDFPDKEDLKKFAESYKGSMKKKLPELSKVSRKALKDKIKPSKPKGAAGGGPKDTQNKDQVVSKNETPVSGKNIKEETKEKPKTDNKKEVEKKRMEIEPGSGTAAVEPIRGKRTREQLNPSEPVPSHSGAPNKKQQEKPEPRPNEMDTESLNTRDLKKVHREEPEKKDGELPKKQTIKLNSRDADSGNRNKDDKQEPRGGGGGQNYSNNPRNTR